MAKQYPKLALPARQRGHDTIALREVWEPYRILHPTVAKLLSERHFVPASGLRIIGGYRDTERGAS